MGEGKERKGRDGDGRFYKLWRGGAAVFIPERNQALLGLEVCEIWIADLSAKL